MAKTIKHINLPRLTDENFSIPKKTGHWEDQGKGIIAAISDGIKVSENSETQGISSIPDVWGRPLMFQAILNGDPSNPLTRRFKQEWRGLLSLLALSRYRNFPRKVEVVPVDLDGGKLSGALTSLAPRDIQLEPGIKYSWKDILMIRYGSIPLGAFSPTTLVYTASSYNHLLMKEDFSLRDPKTGYLRPPDHKEDIEIVGEWLMVLQDELNKHLYCDEHANPDCAVVGRINGLVEEWIKDIKVQLGMRDDEEIDSSLVKVSDECIQTTKPSQFLSKYRVYQAVLHPVEKEVRPGDSAEGNSAFSLIADPRNPYKEVVVVTDRLLATQSKIWGTLNLRDLGGNASTCIEKYFNAPSGDTIANTSLKDNDAIWIRPEKYFLTDTLLKSRRDSLPMHGEAGFNGDETGFILPFTKEILGFFSPQNIVEVLKPTYKKEENGNIRFSFILPTKAGPEKIEKLYKTKLVSNGEGGIAEIDTPVVEIFPKYLGEHWRRYYVMQSNADMVSVEPVVTGDCGIHSRSVTDTDGSNKQYMRFTELRGDNAFPEGLEVAAVSGAGKGLMLVDRDDKNYGLSHKWKIGIDFGTSNTNVFKQRSNSDNAERWSFDFPKYTRRITSSEDGVRRDMLHRHFIPASSVAFPVPTTLKIPNLSSIKDPILDYFLYFPPENDYKLPLCVYSDLKWDVEADRKTKYFIESLLFLILIEVISSGIEEVEFLWSYPKAFSDENKTVLMGEWASVFKSVFEGPERVVDRYRDINDSGKKIKIVNLDKKNIDRQGSDAHSDLGIRSAFHTEGKAAGEFFGSVLTIQNPVERADKENAALCLDVGGGTTDISIWYDGHIKFDASVMLAGRQIAQLFRKNRRLAELLFTREAAIALEEKVSEPGYYAARLNLILRDQEDQIKDRLLEHAGQSDVKWLRKLLAIEFCALSYYTAILCAYADKGEIDGGLSSRIGDAGIGLHWGGNAAKFINWIDLGRYVSDGIGSTMLSAVFYNSMKDAGIKSKKLSQHQSPGHKSEAAGGLVVMEQEYGQDNRGGDNRSTGQYVTDDNDGESTAAMFDVDVAKNKYKSFGIVCGENIELMDGRKVDFADAVSNSDLFDNNKTSFNKTSLDRLMHFIEVLNTFGGQKGLFSESTKVVLSSDYKQLIKDHVRSEFVKAQRLPEAKRRIEPIFIMEVKVLLDLLINELR